VQPLVSPFPHSDNEANENTPLLSSPPGSVGRHLGVHAPRPVTRTRTISISSTVYSNVSGSPSLAQTLYSAFQPDLDSDLDREEERCEREPERRHLARRQDFSESSNEQEAASREVELDWRTRWKKYFRPMRRRAYYSAVFHLLVLNFPFALAAWIYLFVFTLVCVLLWTEFPS
jgi:hypothetical protein